MNPGVGEDNPDVADLGVDQGLCENDSVEDREVALAGQAKLLHGACDDKLEPMAVHGMPDLHQLGQGDPAVLLLADRHSVLVEDGLLAVEPADKGVKRSSVALLDEILRLFGVGKDHLRTGTRPDGVPLELDGWDGELDALGADLEIEGVGESRLG